MFGTVAFLYGVFQVLAFRGNEVAPLIQDQSADDATVVKPSTKVQSGTSFTVLSAEGLDSSKSPEESKNLELPNCSDGTLQLESGTYKVAQQVEIPESCTVTSKGATLLLSARLKFLKTARFEGKLFVKGSGSLEGCFWFREDAFIQSSAEMHFADCHNVKKGATGGAIHMRGNLIVTGTLSIHNCSAAYGGGIYVLQTFIHSEGKIEISASSAKVSGGGIYVHQTFTNSGRKLKISGSSAKVCGGGIYVNQTFIHSEGKIEISASSAKRGGGIYVKDNFTQSGGSLSVTNSSATDAGCLFAWNNTVFANAMATFSQCHAQDEGGGIATWGNVSLTNASLKLELATAGKRGAAVFADHLEQTGGDMTVYNSSARGEVITVEAVWIIDGGAFQLHHCKAADFLMSATLGATLNAFAFVVSHASAAGMLQSHGEVTMRNSVFNQASSPQLRAKVVKVTNLSVVGIEAWISWTSEISAESTVQDMDCDDFFGGYNRSDGIGCAQCHPGSVFVKNITEKTIANPSAVQHCVPCPEGTRLCNATTIEMSPGMMVGQNISRGFHCPNPLACEGGHVSSNASTEMCAKGYEDVGCAKCTNDCARSNSNVFICLRCATGTWILKDILLFFASDAVILVISAAGVVSAGRQNKNSTVYLNQLMAFAAVTVPALVALRNTPTFEHQQERMQQIFTFISFPVQAGDAGESSMTVSTGCILRYFGLEPTLVLSQVLSSLVYMVLTLCLAVKSGARVALVVGINCFLPKFCSAFGTYLICFRMEPAPLGQAHCLAGANPFFGITIAVLAIILCFLVGPGSWIRMTKDKSLKDEPQVLFLTRSYRKGFETWEVERLVRKMLLKIINIALPITLNPSTQMGCFSFVLMASLVLHASQAPYTKDRWNQIELGLLVMALLVVNLTTMCLANEIHWAHSEKVQVMLMVVITVIVAIAGGLQSFLLIRELILERLPQPLHTPELMEPIEPAEGGEDGEASKS